MTQEVLVFCQDLLNPIDDNHDRFLPVPSSLVANPVLRKDLHALITYLTDDVFPPDLSDTVIHKFSEFLGQNLLVLPADGFRNLGLDNCIVIQNRHANYVCRKRINFSSSWDSYATAMRSTLEKHSSSLHIEFNDAYVLGMMEGFDCPYTYTERTANVA